MDNKVQELVAPDTYGRWCGGIPRYYCCLCTYLKNPKKKGGEKGRERERKEKKEGPSIIVFLL
jgi:hypothetical protein